MRLSEELKGRDCGDCGDLSDCAEIAEKLENALYELLMKEAFSWGASSKKAKEFADNAVAGFEVK